MYYTVIKHEQKASIFSTSVKQVDCYMLPAGTPTLKGRECLSTRDFGLTQGFQNRTPIYEAIKVSFRVAREEINSAVILCFRSSPIRYKK